MATRSRVKGRGGSRGRFVVGVVAGLGVAVVAALPDAASAQDARVLTLREAVESSLEENSSLENARYGLDAAGAQVREAWGSVLPVVNFNASYQRNLDIPTNYLPATIFNPDADPDELVGVQFGADNQWYAQARADQPLFDAAAFLGVGAADRYATLQGEVVRGQAQQVATETRLQYYGVLLAQEQHRLTAQSVARVEQVLDETRSLNRAGLSSEYDVLRLEVELSNLQPNLRRAENAAGSARRSLAVAMGVESLEGVELAGSLLAIELPELPGLDPVAPIVLVASDATPTRPAARTDLLLERGVMAEAMPEAAVVEIATRNRSDLRQLEQTRALRETERKVEISQYLPKISVFGTWTAQGQGQGSPRFFGDQNFAAKAVGVEVSVPLFSGLQRPARVSRMSAVVDQLDAQLDYAREQAENEVRTLHEQARESYERASAQQRAVRQAQRGYEIARKEYRAGLGSQLQVTDAELALRQSEFNYAQAVYDYLTAQARLDAAIGVVPLVDEGNTVVASQR